MNKYDELYDFRLAYQSEVLKIMKFLKREYAENHILANDKQIFEFQYKAYGNINVFLMLEKKTQKIVGLNGFVVYSNASDRLYISSALTKVIDTLPIPMSGIELIKRFKDYTKAKAYFSSGTNPKTMAPIGKKYFGYDVGIMQQYYFLNPSVKEYHICKINHKIEYNSNNFPIKQLKFVSFNNFTELQQVFDFSKSYKNLPYKSGEYIKRRFFEHPIYQYKVYGLKDINDIKAILVARVVQHENIKVIRFVDYIGDIENLAYIGQEVKNLLQKQNLEYADFLLNGVPQEIMELSGFKLRNAEDENIIPTYFEPFVQKNVDIWFQSSEKNLCIFKADGDQDRPNYRGNK